MTTGELIHHASSIRDEDTRQEAILGLLEAGDAIDLSEARAICRRARFRAAWAVRQQRNRTVSQEVVTEAAPAEMVRTGAMTHAFKLLALLPEHQRQAFMLKHVSGYSTRQTAELLGVDRRTIARWLTSARKKFGAHVAPEAVSAPTR